MGVSPTRSLIKRAGLAFLIVALLTGAVAEEATAQQYTEITPQQLVIYGIIGTTLFQHPFTVRAVGEDITELTFSPSNLMEVSRGKSWITGASVQVTPAVRSIKKGQSQDFVVTVQNIPESGQYDGTIGISYKEQSPDARDTLLVSVRAAKFSVVPPQVVLRFEKSLLGLSETDGVSWTLALNEETGRAPQGMMTTLAKGTSASLDPLVHTEDKSQVIRPEQMLAQPITTEARAAGQGLTMRATFTNPQVRAGKYTGIMTVRSEELGLLASVPVEVQVRYPSWLAWLLIVAGIIASLLINWWNTTGKKKNAIRGKALNLSEKLRSADITTACRTQIEDVLDKVRELLDDTKLEEAERGVTDAITKLDACVSHKKSLREKAVQIQDLMDNLDKLEKQFEDVVALDAAVLRTYLPSVKQALETLKNDIDEERYLSVDEPLNQKVSEQKGKLDAFTAPAPDGLLDSLAELEGDLKLVDEAYRPALEQQFIRPIKVHLGAVVRDKDVKDVAGEIESARTHFGNVSKLSSKLETLQRQIENGQQQGLDMDKARKELKKCKGYLASGNVSMAEEHLDDVEKAIDEAARLTVAKTDPDILIDFDAALSLENRLDRSTKMAGILSNILDTKELTEQSKTSVYALKNMLDTRVEILQSKLAAPDEIIGRKAAAAIPCELVRRVRPRLFPPLPSMLESFRGWWNPQRQERAISIVLFLMVIPILAIIGFGQLYANNFTFGAKSVLEEYLTLFLWGFGIQTGTATVATVLKTIRGS